MASEPKEISFEELCEVRIAEMTHMMPGLMTKVEWKGKQKKIYSPGPFQRSLFRCDK